MTRIDPIRDLHFRLEINRFQQAGFSEVAIVAGQIQKNRKQAAIVAVDESGAEGAVVAVSVREHRRALALRAQAARQNGRRGGLTANG